MKTNANPANYPLPLREQLAETCLMQRYLIETIDLQLEEPSSRAHSESHGIVIHALEVLLQHTRQLGSVLETLKVGRRELENCSARIAKNFTSFVRSCRPRELRSMLQSDQALLELVARSYMKLHATAVALRDLATAALALTHLQELVALTRDLGRLLPERAGDAA